MSVAFTAPPADKNQKKDTKQPPAVSSSNDDDDNAYIPHTVWEWKQDMSTGNAIVNINRPTTGPRFDKALPPRGNHALQLYSLATPKGIKVTIFLEELLAAGYNQAEYDAYRIDILQDQDQFSSGFCEINPNSKMPALVDYSNQDDPENGTRVFELAHILLYLAEKFDHAFLPAAHRTEVLNWLFWQAGAAPFLGGGFGHFYHYAHVKMEYPIDRYTMETKRQLDVLNRHLSSSSSTATNGGGGPYMVGTEYTIADMALFPWYGGLVLGF